jgi:penicillin-insensitive murein DD-endopeptidase
MRTIRTSMLALLFVSACSTATTKPEDWAKITTAANGDPSIYGKYTNGCVRGAEELPNAGPGFSRYKVRPTRGFGHPDLVSWLTKYSLRLSEKNLGVIIEDLSQPRGGPMPGGHGSHQVGLDADLWYYAPSASKLSEMTPAQVLKLAQRPMLGSNGRVDPKLMTQSEVLKVKLAAQSPGIERIFVHTAIKVYLCDQEKDADREWLRVLRPWKGHVRHFHVRLSCPTDSPDCEIQEATPPGDGCAEAQQRLTEGFPADWFVKPAVRPELPDACTDVLRSS